MPAAANPLGQESADSGSPDAEVLWGEVVARVKERKIMTGVFLAESRQLGWEGNTLLLGADEVHRSLLEAKENRELLLEIARKVFGRPVLLKFVEKRLAPSAPPPATRVSVVAPRATAADPAPEEEIEIEDASPPVETADVRS